MIANISKNEFEFSIITVSYNSETVIKDTIESVLTQTFRNFEYIVIDGNSKDSTKDIIESYESEFRDNLISLKWISEEDCGIYDAMNKGIKLASGKWINFMNCGDTFCSNNILQNIAIKKFNDKEVGLLYGDSIFIDSKNRNIYNKIKKDLYKLQIKKITPFVHQSVFHSKYYIEKIGDFSINYKIMGDYEWFVKLFKYQKNAFEYLDIGPISNYSLGGLSCSLSIKGFEERIHIVKNYFSTRHHLILIFHFFIFKLKKIVLPYIEESYILYLYRRIKY